MRTLFFNALTISALTGSDLDIPANTTLNEYHAVGTRYYVELPKVSYFTVGQRAFPRTLFNESKYHLPKHGNVYKPLPIRFMRLDDDLKLTDKLSYRLRKVMTLNGIDYVAYYMKVLTSEGNGRYLNVEVGIDGTEEISFFNNIDTEILRPTKKQDLSKITADTFQSIGFTKPSLISLTSQEFEEMQLASQALYEEDLDITEFLICSGDDQPLQDGSMESNAVQAAVFIEREFPIDFKYADDFSFAFELGGIDLMLEGN